MDPSPSASAGDRPREGIGRSDGAFRLAGEWLVEPALHRLRRLDGAGRAGDPLQVEPKVLGVLVELSREPGRVVSQEALRERVWGSAHVSDEVVRRAIYELRKLLGEEASAPRYIETVPRVGYRLTELGGPTIRTPSWSPDGRWIAFVAGVGGDADLWRIDARGGLPERLTAGPDHEVAPWWSRDGRWLYYASNRTGRWEIWRQPAGDQEGEERSEQVTRAGGHRGAESADGRWLYFTKRGEPGLWRRPLEDGGEATLVLPELGGRREGDWALGPRGVLFVTKDAEHHAVLARFTPEEGAGRGAVETVARLEDWPMNPSLALAPDGSWLVYSQGHDVESDVVLAERVF